jgi:ParB family chromosome partitioning protein
MSDPTKAHVRLSDLYLHPLNARSEPREAEIDQLADSIAEIGLLHDLSGFADPGAADLLVGKIGIVAGGRRLRALRLLHPDDDPMIPVTVTDDRNLAAEWAGAENTARAALHPADEVAAYRKMADQGADPNRIARAFAVTERHVRQRLRLSSLPQPALDALRQNKITLDQAAALTAAPTDDALLTELERVTASRWGVSANEIRNTFTRAAVTTKDRRAIFVGLDNYTAAGGRVQEDLFVDHTVLLDVHLLDEMFAQRLDDCVEFAKMRSFAWVEPFNGPHAPYELTRDMTKIHRKPIDLPEADAEELDALKARAETEKLTDAEIDRIDELEERAAGDYDEAELAESGIWLYVDHAGKVQRHGPFRKPAPQAEGDDDAATVTAKPETIPQNLRDDLRIISTLAIQTELLSRPELMLDLLALTLTAEVYPWHRPLALDPTSQTLAPSKPDGAVIDSRLAAAIPENVDSRKELSIEMLRQMQTDGKKARNAAITAALASTFHQAGSDFGKALAAMLRVDARKVWTPNAENYFKRLPMSALDTIWTELVPPDLGDHETYRGLKKAEKAKQLDQLFNSDDFREALGLSREMNATIDRWLPEELRIEAVTEAPEQEAA